MRAPGMCVALLLLSFALGAGAASAQSGAPAQPPVPYTPPTVYAPPRTFQHTQPPADAGAPQAVVVVPGGRYSSHGRGVDVAVPIPLGPAPPQSQAQLTSQIIGEFSECLAYGTDRILDCLRQNHNSVTIRRLEACLRSETIPEDPGEVQACLAAGHW